MKIDTTAAPTAADGEKSGRNGGKSPAARQPLRPMEKPAPTPALGLRDVLLANLIYPVGMLATELSFVAFGALDERSINLDGRLLKEILLFFLFCIPPWFSMTVAGVFISVRIPRLINDDLAVFFGYHLAFGMAVMVLLTAIAALIFQDFSIFGFGAALSLIAFAVDEPLKYLWLRRRLRRLQARAKTDCGTHGA